MFLGKRVKFVVPLFFALVCVGCIHSVYSHGRLVNPIPREGNGLGTDGTTAIKLTLNLRNPTDPDLQCGGTLNNDIALQGTPQLPLKNRYRPGSKIPVTWDITIPHDSAPGVKIAMSFSQTDSYNDNVLEPEGLDAGSGGENTKEVTLPDKSGQAVLKWQWCSNEDGGCYITCADVLLDPTVPVASAGNSPGVSATIDNRGDSGGTVVVVLLVIIGLLAVAYFGYKYWAAQDRRQFESELRENNAVKPAVGMVTLSAKGVEKKRRGTFKDNRSIRRPPPTSRAGKLQPGWHEAFDPDSGDKYYYHDDGTTSWEKPQPFESRGPRQGFQDSAPLPPG